MSVNRVPLTRPMTGRDPDQEHRAATPLLQGLVLAGAVAHHVIWSQVVRPAEQSVEGSR